jgi:hypothetical protein
MRPKMPTEAWQLCRFLESGDQIADVMKACHAGCESLNIRFLSVKPNSRSNGAGTPNGYIIEYSCEWESFSTQSQTQLQFKYDQHNGFTIKATSKNVFFPPWALNELAKTSLIALATSDSDEDTQEDRQAKIALKKLTEKVDIKRTMETILDFKWSRWRR